jgi:hypothetical protein
LKLYNAENFISFGDHTTMVHADILDGNEERNYRCSFKLLVNSSHEYLGTLQGVVIYIHNFLSFTKQVFILGIPLNATRFLLFMQEQDFFDNLTENLSEFPIILSSSS